MREELQVFATAARCKSFSEAARQLAIPSSSVSRKIGALEYRLGAALFIRTTRHIDLTEAGRVYYASVQRALAELQLGATTIADLNGDVRGTLIVDARDLIGARLIAPVLPELRRRHPLLKVQLRSGSGVNSQSLDGADVGVRHELAPDSPLVARQFAPSRRLLLASPLYLVRRGLPKQPLELLGHECISCSPDGRPVTWRFRRDEHETSVDPQGTLTTDNVPSMLAAAVAGLGMCVAHDWMAAEELRSGTLYRLLPDHEVTTSISSETSLSLVYPAHLRESPKLRAFMDCVLDRYKNGPAITF